MQGGWVSGKRPGQDRRPLSVHLPRQAKPENRSDMEHAASEVRMDKWLWAVRLFKTRALAIQACQNGRVCIQGAPIKPARSVRVGEVIVVSGEGLQRTVRVLQPIDRRVGAKEVPLALEDLTPAEEYERARQVRANSGFTPRPKGSGRPTKKDRRALNQLDPL